MIRSLAVLCMIGALAWPSISNAARHELVGINSALRLSPRAYELEQTAEVHFDSAMVWNDYATIRYIDSSNDNIPLLTLYELQSALYNGFGWWHVFTHGSPTKLDIEYFAPGAFLYQSHVSQYASFPTDEWYAENVLDTLTLQVIEQRIGIHKPFVSRRFSSQNSVIHIMGCAAFAWHEAFINRLAFLGYNANITNITCLNDALRIYSRMSTQARGADRTLRGGVLAANSAGLQADYGLFGDRVVLAPSIELEYDLFDLVPNGYIPESGTVRIGFDCVMDTSVPIANFVRANNGYQINAQQSSWLTGDDVLQLQFAPPPAGTGPGELTLIADGNGQSAGLRGVNGVSFNGNVRELRPTGNADFYWNRDNFELPYLGRSDAFVANFRIASGEVSDTVSWRSLFEDTGEEWIVERATTPSGPWELRASLPQSLTYSYQLTNSRSGCDSCWYRLRSITTSGDSLVHEMDRAPSVTTLAPPYDELNSDSLLAVLANTWPPESPQAEPSEWVCITPEAFASAAQPLASYWVSMGKSARVVTLESIGGVGQIKSYLQNLWQSSGLRHALLMGDANDAVQWNAIGSWPNGWYRPQYPAQSAFNFIPMGGYVWETGSPAAAMTASTPYYGSDWPYVDFDNDGLPDMSIGRAPVRTAGEVAGFVTKTIAAATRQSGGVAYNRIDVWAYGRDNGANRGWPVAAGAEVVAGLMPTQFTTEIHIDEEKAPLTSGLRTSAALAALGYGRSLVAVLGTSGSRQSLSRWLEAPSTGWTSVPAWSTYPFILGMSCFQGDVDETEDPTLGRPLLESGVVHASVGPSGYFGPSRGSYQFTNEHVGREFLSRAYATQPATTGEAAYLAVRDAAAVGSKARKAALSFVLVGDPLVTLPQTGPGPFSIAVSGPASIAAGASGQFVGNGVGGERPYTHHRWRYRYPGSAWSGPYTGSASYNFGFPAGSSKEVSIELEARSGVEVALDTVCVQKDGSSSVPLGAVVVGPRAVAQNVEGQWNGWANEGGVCRNFRYEWRVRASYSPNWSAVLSTEPVFEWSGNESVVIEMRLWGVSATAAIDTHFVNVPSGGCPVVDVWTEGGWAEENSILGRTQAGQTTRDALKLTQTLQPISGRYRLRIRENGNDRTVLDALSLILASPNDSDQVVALGDSAMFGVLQPIHRAYLSGGMDVTDLVTAGAGRRRFVGEPGDTLYVEPYGALARGVLETASANRPRVNPGGIIVDDDGDKGGGGGLRTGRPFELSAYRSEVDADILNNTGYVVQAQTGTGEWASLDHRYPRAEISQYALEVGSPNLLRFVFIGRHTIGGMGTGIVSGQPERTVKLELVRAVHSRLGDMRSRLRWADGISAGIEPGDTLEIEVRALDQLTTSEPTMLLVTKGYYSDHSGLANGLQSAMGAFVNAIAPARPNPMSTTTTFAFQLRDPSSGTLQVYDVAGRHVKTLVQGDLEAGPHEVVWDGTNSHGRRVPVGLYFYRLSIPGWAREGKLTMLR